MPKALELRAVRELTADELTRVAETLRVHGIAAPSQETFGFVQRLLAGRLELRGFDPRYLRTLERELAAAADAFKSVIVQLYASKVRRPADENALCDAMGRLESVRMRFAKALVRVGDELSRPRPRVEASAPRMHPVVEERPHEQQAHPASRGCRAPPKSSEDDDPAPEPGS